MDKLINGQNIWVREFLFECPLGKLLADCPLKGMRECPRKGQINIEGALGVCQLTRTIGYYDQHLMKREIFRSIYDVPLPLTAGVNVNGFDSQSTHR